MKNLIQKALVDAGFELGANDPDFMTAYFQDIMLDMYEGATIMQINLTVRDKRVARWMEVKKVTTPIDVDEVIAYIAKVMEQV